MSVSPVCSCVSCPTHASAAEKPPTCGFYPSSSLTDVQWALLEPLLPPGNTAGRGGRPEKHPRRRVLDAIFHLVRNGRAGAALPAEFPPAKTVYGIFRRWAAAGVRARLHDALRDRARVRAGRQPNPTAAVIDSASVRSADTVPARSRGYDAGKKVNGRKRHLAVDAGGLLLAVVVTIAGIQDRDGAVRLPAALRARFSTIALIWADGGYTGRLVSWARAGLAVTVTIVKRTDDLAGFRVLPRRWMVERTLAWISKYRRCVRDYETLPEHSEAMVHIAMIMTMSRRLAR